MSSQIDVFIIGESADLPAQASDTNASVQLRFTPTGARTVGEFPETPWARQFMEGDGEFAALVCGSVADAVWQIDSGVGATVAVDPVDGADSSIDPTNGSGIGRGMRILLAPRAGHGPIIFRRNSLKKVGPLRSVGEPVWDWLMRAVRAGVTIVSTPVSAGPRSTECRFPLLAPPRPGRDAGWLCEHLEAFSPGDLGLKPLSKVNETALRAGLHQWHDFLDESHQLSQSIEG